MPEDLEPSTPEEQGTASRTPDLAQVEAARLLANDAREPLHDEGFSDEQIRAWAETYVAEQGSAADLADFWSWIERRQR